MTNESEFSRWFCKKLRDHGCFVQRIETSTGNGVPDVWAIFKGKAVWFELKYDTLHIRPEQYIWARKAYKASAEPWLAPTGDKVSIYEKQVHVVVGHPDKTFSVGDPTTAEPWKRSFLLNKSKMISYEKTEFEAFLEATFECELPL